MKPRLPSSLKWTALPKEFAQKVKKVFTENFKTETEAGEFIVDGQIFAEEVLLRVGYLESGRIKQINFEASSDFSIEKADAVAKIYVCIDAIASMMEEAFQKIAMEEDFDFPLQWELHEFEGQHVYLQHSTVNTRLEEEADRILGLANESLVQERIAEEDALAQAVIDTELAKEVQRRIRSGLGVS